MEIHLISLILGGFLWELIRAYICNLKEKRRQKNKNKIQ